MHFVNYTDRVNGPHQSIKKPMYVLLRHSLCLCTTSNQLFSKMSIKLILNALTIDFIKYILVNTFLNCN